MMGASAATAVPRMSVVLATDAYETLRPVVAALREQPDRAHLELLIVAPAETLGPVDWAHLSVFAAARVVRVDAPLSLPAARAAGVRAASAPIVFVGETHSFPQPGMTDTVVAGFTDERCVAVVPAIANANPASALSWASYLGDYGVWGPGRPAGLLDQPLVYNTAFRRQALIALGGRLDELLDSNSEELWPILHRQGYYARFEPDAQTNHVNAAQLRALVRIRFFAGMLIGTMRARKWSRVRRFVYIAASPAIPVVLMWRVRSIVRFGAPFQRLPGGTMAGVALGAVAKTLGEVAGYLGIRVASAERRLTDNELHKLRYARLGTSVNDL